MSHRCCGLLFALLLPAFSLAAQQVASDPPLQWHADSKANKQAERAAEKAAEAEVPPIKGGGRGKGAPPDGEGPSGGMDGAPGGGMDGSMGGGSDGPGGGTPPEGGQGGPGGGPGGKGGGESRVTAAWMLRPEMDFAAPLKDTLVLYRSREAVVFGRAKSDAVVILPLSGEAVQIAPGERASVHQEGAGLRVEIVTSNDIRVTFRYSAEPGNLLRVKVHAEGGIPRPGSHFDVERVYRLATTAH